MKRKTITMLLLVFFLIIAYLYVLSIDTLPNNLVVFEGENIALKTILGLNIKTDNDTVETVANSGQAITKKTGKASLQVNLFNNIPIKNVNVDILPKTQVIPIGSIAGVKLYTSGVLVVGMSEIEGDDNKIYKPYENTGIKEGDRITEINDTQISTTDDLINTVNKSNGNKLQITYIHNEETKECSIIPTKTSNKEYKLGLWVRDSAARSGYNNFL